MDGNHIGNFRLPFGWIAAMFDEKISDHIIRVSNLHKEVETVKKCLEHPNICMNQCVPDMSNLEQELSQDKFIITNVNYYALLEEDKYNGHFVIVEDMIDNKLVLQNPGPPPIENQEVTTDVFLKAWHSPNKDLANIIAVSQVV